MPINQNDIQCVLSGGTYNADPNLSLGDSPSLRVVWGRNNNLFNNVDTIEARDGNIDYRCVYVVNNNATDSFFDTRIYFEQAETAASSMEIGIAKDTDVQQIIISGIAEGGSCSLQYEDSVISVDWKLQLSTWARAFQDALNALSELGGVVVTASSYSNGGSTRDLTRVFEIRFEGVSNYRYHSILQLVSNNIVGTPVISISKVKNGCPINSVAAKIDVDTIEPYGITWSVPSSLSPLSIGTIRGGDSFPIWIKRITPPNTPFKIADGFTLKILGKPS